MTSPKIDKITEPKVKLNNEEELNRALHRLTLLLRRLDRYDSTLDRRKSSAVQKHKDVTKPVITEVEPLIDQVFWHVYMQWDSLITGRATESVKLSEAEFKRHIDTVGTVILNNEVAVQYLENIDSSDFALKLRQAVGDEPAQVILNELKGLISIEIVKSVDKSKFKKLLEKSPSVTVEGVELRYTNRLTMIPAQTQSQKVRSQKPTTVVRQIP